MHRVLFLLLSYSQSYRNVSQTTLCSSCLAPFVGEETGSEETISKLMPSIVVLTVLGGSNEYVYNSKMKNLRETIVSKHRRWFLTSFSMTIEKVSFPFSSLQRDKHEGI